MPRRPTLGPVAVALVLLVAAVALPLSAPAVGAADAAGAATDRQDPDEAVIHDRLQNRTGGGNETVVVRMTPADLPPWHERQERIATELSEHATESQAAFERFAAEHEGVSVERSFWIVNALVVTVDTDAVAVRDLATVDGVDAIHPNFEVEVTAASPADGAEAPADGGNATVPYGVEAVGAPQVWERHGTRGEGASVAVIDTGVDTANHSDLDEALAGWAEFGADGAAVDSDPHDAHGHGTLVSGALVGDPVGVAPDADLYHAKVGDESASFGAVVAALQWSVRQDVDAVSMSLGIPRYDEWLVDPVRNVREAGIPVVAASGNAGEYTSTAPANLPEVVGVGAVGPTGQVANFSGGERVDTDRYWQRGAREGWPDEYVVPTVAAPGVAVNSTALGGGYERRSGTSLATPYVAGVAALVESATDDDLGAAAIEDALVASAAHPDAADPFAVETAPDARYGHGVVDAYHAVSLVRPRTAVEGVVTDGNGTPVSGATVTSETGLSTTTAEDGTFELALPAFEQTLRAAAPGREANATTVDPSADREHGIVLDRARPADVTLVEAPPTHVEPGESIDLAFEVANADAVSVTPAATDHRIDRGNRSLRVDGEAAAFGESVPVEDGTVTITVDPAVDAVGWIGLDVTVEGSGVVREGTTATTRVHPDPYRPPADADLGRVVDLVAPHTTVELAGTHERAVEGNVSLRIAEPVTLTAAPGADPTIRVTGADEGVDVGVAVGANDVGIDGVDVRGSGNLSVGVGTVFGSGVTITGATVAGVDRGVVADRASGTVVADSEFADVGTGVLVSGGWGRVTDNEVAPSRYGVVAVGAFGTVAGNEIRGGDVGIATQSAAVAVADNAVADADVGVSAFLQFADVRGNRIEGATDLGIGATFVQGDVANNRVVGTNGTAIGAGALLGNVTGNVVVDTTGAGDGAIVPFDVSGAVEGNEVRNTSGGPGIAVLPGGPAGNVTDNVVVGTADAPAILVDDDAEAITGNTLRDAPVGIRVTNGSVSAVEGNEVADAAVGIDVVGNASVDVHDPGNLTEVARVARHDTRVDRVAANDVRGSETVGIRVDEASVGVVAGNRVRNATVGVAVDGQASAVEDNAVRGGGEGAGIRLDDADGTVVARNEVRGTGIVAVAGTDDARIEANLVRDSAGDGVRVAGSDGVVVADTTVRGAEGHGVAVVRANGTTVRNVSVRRTGGADLRTATVEGAAVERLRLNGTVVDVAAQGATVDWSGPPADPPNGTADLGIHVAVAPTTEDGRVDVVVRYAETPGADPAEETLALWRHDDEGWQELNSSRANATTVRATVDEAGTVALLGERNDTRATADRWSPDRRWIGGPDRPRPDRRPAGRESRPADAPLARAAGA